MSIENTEHADQRAETVQFHNQKHSEYIQIKK